jgi:hypothetical protein
MPAQDHVSALLFCCKPSIPSSNLDALFDAPYIPTYLHAHTYMYSAAPLVRCEATSWSRARPTGTPTSNRQPAHLGCQRLYRSTAFSACQTQPHIVSGRKTSKRNFHPHPAPCPPTFGPACAWHGESMNEAALDLRSRTRAPAYRGQPPASWPPSPPLASWKVLGLAPNANTNSGVWEATHVGVWRLVPKPACVPCRHAPIPFFARAGLD